jgi:tetratricopeptide (TPR) repeat protein
MTHANRALSTDVARTFRLLGCLPPASTVDSNVIAAVCAVDQASGARLLELLVEANLLQDQRTDEQRAAGAKLECALADTAVDLARQQAAAEPPAAQESARRRWVEWYLLAATEAEARLTPSHRSLRRTPRELRDWRPLFDEMSDSSVLEWLEGHRSELLSAVFAANSACWDDLVWQLTDAMFPLFLRGRFTEDWIIVHQEYGLPAAERDGDSLAVRRMLTTLGGGLRNAGETNQALSHYNRALANARQDAQRRDEAQALDGIGACHQEAGRPNQALPPLLEALNIRKEIGYDRGVGLTRIRIAEALADQGNLHEALEYLLQARLTLLEIGDGYDAARALAILGRTHVRDGHTNTGELHLRQAGREFGRTGSRHWQARVLEWLGEAARGNRRPDKARKLFATARTVYASVHSARDAERLDVALRGLAAGGGAQ